MCAPVEGWRPLQLSSHGWWLCSARGRTVVRLLVHAYEFAAHGRSLAAPCSASAVQGRVRHGGQGGVDW